MAGKLCSCAQVGGSCGWAGLAGWLNIGEPGRKNKRTIVLLTTTGTGWKPIHDLFEYM